MKGQKQMMDYLKGEMGEDAFSIAKGGLKVADLFKMAKGMGYEGDDDDDDDDDVHIDVNVGGEDAEDLEKSGRDLLDALVDAIGVSHAESQTDLFAELSKGMRDSSPFAAAVKEADTLRKSNADAGGLVKSLVTGTVDAFHMVGGTVQALGDRLDGQSELVMLAAEAAVKQSEAMDAMRHEIADLRKSLGMPDPQGRTATPVARFAGEGAQAATAGDDLVTLHNGAMQALRKSIRECKAAKDAVGAKRLSDVSAQVASLSSVVQNHGEKAHALLKGLSDESLIKSITNR